MNTTVRAGFWRLTQYSTVFDCPYPHACLGGGIGSYGDALCDSNYKGYLCAELSDDHTYLSYIGQEDAKCSQTAVATPIILVILVLLVLIGLIMYVSPQSFDAIDQPKDEYRSTFGRVIGYIHEKFMGWKTSKEKNNPSRLRVCASGETSRTQPVSSAYPASLPTALNWLVTCKILICYLQVSAAPAAAAAPVPAAAAPPAAAPLCPCRSTAACLAACTSPIPPTPRSCSCTTLPCPSPASTSFPGAASPLSSTTPP